MRRCGAPSSSNRLPVTTRSSSSSMTWTSSRESPTASPCSTREASLPKDRCSKCSRTNRSLKCFSADEYPHAHHTLTMLSIAHLNQYYGGSHILRNVGFEVPDGKCTALLGRNGVGKTTLLKCLMGLLPIRSGEIRLRDMNIASLPPYARAALGIGYVPQGREIFPRLTVGENLEMGLATQRKSAGVPSFIFEMFPVLKDMLGRRGGDLSGGQQQQLAIGRALAMRPKILILDEPTEGIQPSIIKDIERAIRKLTSGGEMAILLVEQYYDFAKSLADRYVVMSRGEVVANGDGADMDAAHIHRFLAV